MNLLLELLAHVLGQGRAGWVLLAHAGQSPVWSWQCTPLRC